MHFQIVHGWKITREIRKCFKLYVNENTSYEYLLNAANICWRRRWHPTPGLLPGKSHGQRILVGYSSWGHKELDMTERLHFHSLYILEIKKIIIFSQLLNWWWMKPWCHFAQLNGTSFQLLNVIAIKN